MGLPGAGKSTLAATFVARGYARLNRDEAGGSLRGLLPALDRLLASGGIADRARQHLRVTQGARAPVIQAAAKAGLPVRCVWLSTSLEDAQVNAAARIVGEVRTAAVPEEMRELSKRDVIAFGPVGAIPLSA